MSSDTTIKPLDPDEYPPVVIAQKLDDGPVQLYPGRAPCKCCGEADGYESANGLCNGCWHFGMHVTPKRLAYFAALDDASKREVVKAMGLEKTPPVCKADCFECTGTARDEFHPRRDKTKHFKCPRHGSHVPTANGGQCMVLDGGTGCEADCYIEPCGCATR